MAQTKGEKAAQIALTLIGCPYETRPAHAAGPRGFDCSGLITFAFGKVGLDVPHQSQAQRRFTKRIPRFQSLKPGDLVFYYDSINPSHVAMYVGRTGKIGSRIYWVVQATNEARGVERIKMNAYTKAVGYGRVPGAQAASR